MIRRAGLIALAFVAASFLLLPLFAFSQQRPTKPTLYIIHSDSCPPCRVFDKVFCDRENFQAALRKACILRELDWDVPDQRAEAIAIGVQVLPTYVLFRDGRIVARHIGFASSTNANAVDEAIQQLMNDLQIEWPPARQTNRPADRPEARPADRLETKPVAPKPKAIAEIQPARPAEPMIDRDAREAITRLATQSKDLASSQTETQSQVKALSASLQEIREDVSQSTSALQSQIELSAERSGAQLDTISQSLRKSIESVQSSTREELRSVINSRTIELQNNQTQTDERQANSPADTSPDDATPPTASKWLKLLAWAGKTGLAIAAPEVAIPGSIALTAAGLGLQWLRWRRKPKPLGSVENPIRVADNGEVRTETKFVVSESDVLGESFREAIRRVGNSHRESSPHIVDVLKQVDAAATQLAHGKRVVRRPANAPVSENEP